MFRVSGGGDPNRRMSLLKVRCDGDTLNILPNGDVWTTRRTCLSHGILVRYQTEHRIFCGQTSRLLHSWEFFSRDSCLNRISSEPPAFYTGSTLTFLVRGQTTPQSVQFDRPIRAVVPLLDAKNSFAVACLPDFRGAEVAMFRIYTCRPSSPAPIPDPTTAILEPPRLRWERLMSVEEVYGFSLLRARPNVLFFCPTLPPPLHQKHKIVEELDLQTGVFSEKRAVFRCLPSEGSALRASYSTRFTPMLQMSRTALLWVRRPTETLGSVEYEWTDNPTEFDVFHTLASGLVVASRVGSSQNFVCYNPRTGAFQHFSANPSWSWFAGYGERAVALCSAMTFHVLEIFNRADSLLHACCAVVATQREDTSCALLPQDLAETCQKIRDHRCLLVSL